MDGVVRLAAAVEARVRREAADGGAIDVGERRGTRVVGLLGVGELEQEADVAGAVSEFLGEVTLHLHAVRHVVAGVERAAARLEVAAHVVIGRVVQRTAVAEVDLRLVEVHAFVQRDEPALFLAGVADVVDDRARRLRGVGAGRTTTDAFDIRHGGVEAGPVVVVAELDVAEQHGGQAIFLDLDERRTTGGDRKAADRDVGVTARASRTGDLDARDHAEDFRFRAGLEVFDELGLHARDRHRAVQLGLVTARSRHDDLVEALVAFRGRFLRHGRRLGKHKSDSGGDRRCTAQFRLLHEIPPRECPDRAAE